jgi:hypothetical protein
MLDGNGAVASVGVDFYQEVAANNHRLGFGVIDVRQIMARLAETSSRTNSEKFGKKCRE